MFCGRNLQRAKYNDLVKGLLKEITYEHDEFFLSTPQQEYANALGVHPSHSLERGYSSRQQIQDVTDTAIQKKNE